MQAINGRNYNRSFNRNSNKSMRDPTMMLKTRHWSAQAPDGIDVRKLRSHSHRQRGIRRTAIEACTGKARASEDVRDRFHGLGKVSGCLRTAA